MNTPEKVFPHLKILGEESDYNYGLEFVVRNQMFKLNLGIFPLYFVFGYYTLCVHFKLYSFIYNSNSLMIAIIIVNYDSILIILELKIANLKINVVTSLHLFMFVHIAYF